jgi:hypothetical protein
MLILICKYFLQMYIFLLLGDKDITYVTICSHRFLWVYYRICILRR